MVLVWYWPQKEENMGYGISEIILVPKSKTECLFLLACNEGL